MAEGIDGVPGATLPRQRRRDMPRTNLQLKVLTRLEVLDPFTRAIGATGDIGQRSLSDPTASAEQILGRWRVWHRLSEDDQRRLTDYLPADIADSPYVPFDVRIQCHERIRAESKQDPGDRPVAEAPWVMRRKNGKVYGTGDPNAADSVVAHVVYPTESMDEVALYEDLSDSLDEGQVGVMIVLPEPDEHISPEAQHAAAVDFLDLTLVHCPTTAVTIATQRDVGTLWADRVDGLRQERIRAGAQGEVTRIAGAIGQQRVAAEGVRSAAVSLPGQASGSDTAGKRGQGSARGGRRSRT